MFRRLQRVGGANTNDASVWVSAGPISAGRGKHVKECGSNQAAKQQHTRLHASAPGLQEHRRKEKKLFYQMMTNHFLLYKFAQLTLLFPAELHGLLSLHLSPAQSKGETIVSNRQR